VKTSILENQDVVLGRRSKQQVYHRLRGFFGKPFKLENFHINFSWIVSLQKLRQMQQASSGDNTPHLQVRNLENKDLKEQHSTRKEDYLFEFKSKLLKCYILFIALNGAENLTFRKVDQIYLESLEM
jgi:hypothetical protein